MGSPPTTPYVTAASPRPARTSSAAPRPIRTAVTPATGLVSGDTGCVHDRRKAKDGGQLQLRGRSSYSIHVRPPTPAGSGADTAYTINVTDVNEQPTDIGEQHQPRREPPPGLDRQRAARVTDAGDTDLQPGQRRHGTFTIDGSKTAASFNFEVKSSYSIRVRTTDAGGLWARRPSPSTSPTPMISPPTSP